jgi:hypothetical protein
MVCLLHCIVVFALNHCLCSHFTITLDLGKTEFITSSQQGTETILNSKASSGRTTCQATMNPDNNTETSPEQELRQ